MARDHDPLDEMVPRAGCRACATSAAAIGLLCPDHTLMAVGSSDDPTKPHRYSELQRVLDAALDHAANGKGKERHAKEGVRFEDQPMVALSVALGSNHGPLFQAMKKIVESTRLSPERARLELLGAINYVAGAVLVLEKGSE